jgi:hypothetical protein|tara:strand:+ start:468 stop:686 length:219 start_codon:yes stop_codon:yes gene_type:complete
MKNTEILVLFQIDRDVYGNRIVGFKGNLEEAESFARDKGYDGGIEVIRRESLRNGRSKKFRVNSYGEGRSAE